ncbi:NmrA family NAD(P)-binding protein, partial [Rhizobium ruizarguesonis]
RGLPVRSSFFELAFFYTNLLEYYTPRKEGAFLMTPVVAPPETYEFDIGRDLADAAVEAGVYHIVFSTLENVDEITAGSKFASLVREMR